MEKKGLETMKGWLVFIGLLALIDPRRPQVVTKDVEEN